MSGSASFSFGKPLHPTGKFGIEALGHREREDRHYHPGAGRARFWGAKPFPGVGQYDLGHTDGRVAIEARGGVTGGWAAPDHDIFMRTFGEFSTGQRHGIVGTSLEEAPPEFFDRVALWLPHKSRADLAEHARWMTNYRKQGIRKEHQVAQWRREHTQGAHAAKHAAKDDKEEEKESSKATQKLRFQTTAEMKRAATKHQVDFLPHQRFEGAVLDGNLRGHPEFRKAPGYTFGASRDPRDVTTKRYTDDAGVRSSSHLNNPGPGHYSGVDTSLRFPHSNPPCYSIKCKHPPHVQGTPTLAGPGFDCKHDPTLCSTTRQPCYTIGKGPQIYENHDCVGCPDEIGPGRYGHLTSFRTQFGR
jgi:hypothetical protein